MFAVIDEAARLEMVGAVVSLGGVTVLLTVTVTGAEVVVLPAASVATAVRLYEPLVSVVVFKLAVYGALVSRDPILVAPALNWTLVTPRLSLADALTVTVPEIVAPCVGAVIAT